MTSEQTGPLLSLLHRALGQNPPMAEAYALYANIWLNSELQPLLQDLNVMLAGARLFSNQPAVMVQTSLVLVTNGQLDRARFLMRLGASRAPDDQARALYADLAQRIEALRTNF